MVAVSKNADVVGANGGYDRVYDIGSCYVYIMIDGKWIENGKIVPEDGVAGDQFWTSVSLLGITALFGAPNAGERNRGSAYIYDDISVPWKKHVYLDVYILILYIIYINNNVNGPNYGAVYECTPQIETWVEDKELTESDGVSHEKNWWIIAISGDTLLVGDNLKDGDRGGRTTTRLSL